MSKIRWFVLPFLVLLLFSLAPLTAQESRVTRPIVARFEVDVLVDGRPLPEIQARGRTYVEAFARRRVRDSSEKPVE